MHDIYSYTTPVVAFAPGAKTSSVTGSTIDRADYEAVLFEVIFATWTDGSHTPVMQESDDGSTWSTVSTDQMRGTLTVVDGASEDDMVYSFYYFGSKRYVRLNYTVAGTTTGAVYGAIALKAFPRYAGQNSLTNVVA
jgi:hypothetical protein